MNSEWGSQDCDKVRGNAGRMTTSDVKPRTTCLLSTPEFHMRAIVCCCSSCRSCACSHSGVKPHHPKVGPCSLLSCLCFEAGYGTHMSPAAPARCR
eukprot:366026-Chlamydomonas_euryale.AAC.17